MKVLFADDETSLQELMRIELPRRGHEVTVCPDGLTAVAALERNRFDCLLLDLDMPGLTGIEVMSRAHAMQMEADAIVLTGKSSLPSAIAALRLGAFDYITKPCKMAEVERLLQRVAEKRELTTRCRVLQHRLARFEGKTQIIGKSAAIQQVRNLIEKVAAKSSTVLIRGETGTGKELVARSLHEQSPRHGGPFVAINCGALPESLIESELFGHCKGAFTGADQPRTGLFELAHGGTLFLDEIGELAKPMQAKLLRVLESGEIRRIGDRESLRVDVRVVCATHRDLELMVQQGDFREDLLFRINPFEIDVPPLRERASDIPELAVHLLQRFLPAAHNVSRAQPSDCFTPSVLHYFMSHRWPGNVRELSNALEHASILTESLPIDTEHLPPPRGRQSSPHAVLAKLGPIPLRELESLAVQCAMERNQGNRTKVAEELGISVKTLYNKLTSDEDGQMKAA